MKGTVFRVNFCTIKMAASVNVPHVQAKFYTKQPQYAVADTPFSVPSTVGVNELSSLVNSLLKPGASAKDHVAFDFLINREFLRVSLEKHMDQHSTSTETVLEIEYVERHPAPEPEDSLLHDDWVSAVQALSDYILTGCYDNTVKMWNTEGDLLTTIPGHMAPVKCVSWIKNDDENPVKRFVTGSHDETLLLWEWNQQNNSVDCVHSCRGHAGSVDCVAVDPTKTKFCSGSWDKMLKVWSAVPGVDESEKEELAEKPKKKKKTEGSKVAARVPLLTLSGHNEGVSAALWLSEKEICTSSWDHTIKIWDIEQAAQKSSLTGNKVFFDVASSPFNQLLLSASADRHVRLYDPRITDGALVKCTFTSHTAWVSAVCWSPSSEYQFISGSHDMILKLWDTRSPKAPLYDMTGHEDKILAADWSMPQYMLSGGADNHLRIFRSTDRTSQGVHGAPPRTHTN